MRDINLLPVWYRHKIRLNMLITKTAIILAVIFLLSILTVICFNITIRRYTAAVEYLGNELSSDKYAEAEAVIADIRELTLLIEARGNTQKAEDYNLPGCLTRIFSCMPEDIRAHEIGFSSDPPGFVFKGVTGGAELIAEFVEALNEAGFIGARLTRLNNTADGLSSFAVEFTLSGGEAPL